MFVWGAIAATSAASVMNSPADAARAPFGDTYTTTGIGAAMMSLTISRIESSSPPGVSSRKITRSAVASSRRRGLSTHAADAGLIVRSKVDGLDERPLGCRLAPAPEASPASSTKAATVTASALVRMTADYPPAGPCRAASIAYSRMSFGQRRLRRIAALLGVRSFSPWRS